MPPKMLKTYSINKTKILIIKEIGTDFTEKVKELITSTLEMSIKEMLNKI